MRREDDYELRWYGHVMRREDYYELRWYGHVMRREDDYKLRWYGHVMRRFCYKSGIECEDDGKETERTALVTMDQHQQPPCGREHQLQRCIKNGTLLELYRMEEVDLLPH